MANRIATILGVVFLLVGVLGFLLPTLLGAHLTPAHNIVHLVSGAISLWLGLKGTVSGAKTFCIVFGLVYLLLGVCGFLLGSGAERMLTILPGQLMFGTMDHLIHVALGAIFLIAGLSTKTVAARV
jgi:Domain of unknown function (DUF4383)